MVKIRQIEVKNFKAIKSEIAKFNGCSAIITAGNNEGKTSLLKGLINRFRGEKLDIILKEGESKGYNIIELTDGAIIEWKFTEKTESFAYTTKDGTKLTKGVLSTIGERYFGVDFDIDKFLNSGGQAQTKELQRIVGVDFTDVDKRYKIAFDERTDANKEYKRLSNNREIKPTKIKKPNIDSLKEKLLTAKTSNKKLSENWEKKNKIHTQSILDSNKITRDLSVKYTRLNTYKEELKAYGFQNPELNKFVEKYKPGKEKPLTTLKKPDYTPTAIIEKEIDDTNELVRKYDGYERDLNTYNDWVTKGTEAKKVQLKADKDVKAIEKEKKDLISKAKIPKDFEINEDGLLYKGFPLTNNQISSSGKYIAALKLGAMVLGEIKTMHFDASFLDNKSLSEIQDWANKEDLQLLIERPCLEGGDIKYEII